MGANHIQTIENIIYVGDWDFLSPIREEPRPVLPLACQERSLQMEGVLEASTFSKEELKLKLPLEHVYVYLRESQGENRKLKANC